jgi:hypothetical protein
VHGEDEALWPAAGRLLLAGGGAGAFLRFRSVAVPSVVQAKELLQTARGKKEKQNTVFSLLADQLRSQCGSYL